MELAIQLFCVNESPERNKLQKIISKDKVNVEWHAEDVCRRLIQKTLHIDSKQHPSFWNALRPGLMLGRVRSQPLACVVIDNKETMLVTHYDALFSMLDILLDAEFYGKLKSLRELPLFILKILVSKQGLRRFVFKNISDQCLEEIDTEDLRRKSELGFELYINAIDDLFEFRDFISNDTPPPNIEGRFERPSKRAKQPSEWYDVKEFLEFFPDRLGEDQHAQVLPLNPNTISIILSAYSMLWTDINRLRQTEGAEWDRRAVKMADMRSAFPMMLSFLAEDLDRQTLGRCNCYFSGNQNILETVQLSAQRLRSYLIGGDIIDPRFAEGLSVYDKRAEKLYTLHHQHFKDTVRMHRASLYKTRECSLQPLTTVPVMHLFNCLDDAGMNAGRSLRLREFLHGKDRLEYFAYRFPANVSLFVVEASLAALCSWWDIPMLSDSYVVVPTNNDVVAIVTTPSVMLCMRMISLTRAFIGGIVEPVTFWRFCVRNLVHLPPKTCPELHDIALFCTVAALGCKLQNGNTLRSLATPDNPFFAAYRLLPTLCRASRSFKSNSYENLCSYARLLMWPVSRVITVSINQLHYMRDLLGNSTEKYGDLRKRIKSHIKKPYRYKQDVYRTVLSRARVYRNTKKVLYMHELLYIALGIVKDNPKHAEYLLDDLLKGGKLPATSNANQREAEYKSVGTSQRTVESFGELEDRVRYEEYTLMDEPLMDTEQLTLAYSYLASRGVFVPSLRYKSGMDDFSSDSDNHPAVIAKSVPPQECTADNVREHTQHYFNSDFIEFLYRCFMDSGKESNGASLAEIQTILTAEEPPLLEVRLKNGEEAAIDACFLLNTKIDAQPHPGSTNSDICKIDDRLAQDLVTQYAENLITSDRVSSKMDYSKSYLECIQHLYELMEV